MAGWLKHHSIGTDEQTIAYSAPDVRFYKESNGEFLAYRDEQAVQACSARCPFSGNDHPSPLTTPHPSPHHTHCRGCGLPRQQQNSGSSFTDLIVKKIFLTKLSKYGNEMSAFIVMGKFQMEVMVTQT